MKKILKIFGFIGLVATFCFAMGGAVFATNDPFVCSSNFYQVISGQLKVLDPTSGTYSNIGSNAGFSYNAIGYNSQDNYIYGLIIGGPNANNLVRVGSDGTVTDLGAVTGFPLSVYVNGSFDLSGNLYVVGNDGHTVFKIDVSSMTASTITTTGSTIIGGADNVYINNKLYLLSDDTLSVINLNTNTVSTVTVTGPSGWLNAGVDFGAGWTDKNNELFFSNNGSGTIYQINNFDSLSPTATFKVAGTVTSNNDGASCALADQNPFDPPHAVNDKYAALFNTPLHITADPTLSNDSGNTITVTAHTNPKHGQLSLQSNGTFVYTPNHDFSGTDSFNYTITDSFSRTDSATVTLTVLKESIPKAPDTSYAKPDKPNRVMVFELLAMLTFLCGLALMKRQKQTKN